MNMKYIFSGKAGNKILKPPERHGILDYYHPGTKKNYIICLFFLGRFF